MFFTFRSLQVSVTVNNHSSLFLPLKKTSANPFRHVMTGFSFLHFLISASPGCYRWSLMRTLSDRSPASPLSSCCPAAVYNLFSHQVIKNAAWSSVLINDTWQPVRVRSVRPFIHLWTPTVHLSVHPHTHTHTQVRTHTHC